MTTVFHFKYSAKTMFYFQCLPHWHFDSLKNRIFILYIFLLLKILERIWMMLCCLLLFCQLSYAVSCISTNPCIRWEPWSSLPMHHPLPSQEGPLKWQFGFSLLFNSLYLQNPFFFLPYIALHRIGKCFKSISCICVISTDVVVLEYGQSILISINRRWVATL